VEKTFALTLTKEEDEEFRQFYDETDHCERASLSELANFAWERKIWNKDKVRRFIRWFVLEGLEEGWLVDEMGG